MKSLLGFAESFWGQAFALLALIAILDKASGFKTDVGAATSFTGTVINDLKV